MARGNLNAVVQVMGKTACEGANGIGFLIVGNTS